MPDVPASIRGPVAIGRDFLTGARPWTWEPRAMDDDDGESRPPPPYRIQGDGVAVIPLSGPMSKRLSWWGGASTAWTRAMLKAALADSRVSSILLVLDSPGGHVAGTADLAADVVAANLEKPVVAFVEDLCCSAAYWVASGARAIYANNPTAVVGSIGVYMAVPDVSAAFAKEGIVVHLVTTGPLKGAGAWGTPITEEHLKAWQVEVDDTMGLFEKAVRAGRSMTAPQFAAVSDGGVWVATKAKDLGLIDGIRTLDAVIAGMPKPRRKGAAALDLGLAIDAAE